MADTPNGETAKPEAPSNEALVTSTPPQDTASVTAEVERLRKELEQKELRNRQLENERTAREKADEEAKAKKLEEDNQYKELFEQEKLKREALETENEKKEREDALKQAKSKVLSEYPDEVKTTAAELGLELADVDEATVEEFKGKLDKLSKRVSAETTVGPNNPPQPGSKVEFTVDELQQGLQDENTFHDIVVKKFPGIAAMTQSKKSQ